MPPQKEILLPRILSSQCLALAVGGLLTWGKRLPVESLILRHVFHLLFPRHMFQAHGRISGGSLWPPFFVCP